METPRPTTVIFDFSVFCHHLHGIIENLDIPKEHYLGILKAQLLNAVSADYLGVLKSPNTQTVLCLDSKPYWRVEYLTRPEVFLSIPRKTKAKQKKLEQMREILSKPESEITIEESLALGELQGELEIHYKAGRKFPEYSFSKLKHNLLKIAEAQGWLILAETGYEADDMAASLVMTNRSLPEEQQHDLLLVTVDTDWLGLVDDRTKWFCMSGWYPRYRPDLDTINHWCLKKLKVTLTTPRGIWDTKHKQGDKSDNLPAGTPLEVIDLTQPPLEHRAWEHQPVKGRCRDVLLNPRAIQLPAREPAMMYLKNLGIPSAIRPFNPAIDVLDLTQEQIAA